MVKRQAGIWILKKRIKLLFIFLSATGERIFSELVAVSNADISVLFIQQEIGTFGGAPSEGGLEAPQGPPPKDEILLFFLLY